MDEYLLIYGPKTWIWRQIHNYTNIKPNTWILRLFVSKSRWICITICPRILRLIVVNIIFFNSDGHSNYSPIFAKKTLRFLFEKCCLVDNAINTFWTSGCCYYYKQGIPCWLDQPGVGEIVQPSSFMSPWAVWGKW